MVKQVRNRPIAFLLVSLLVCTGSYASGGGDFAPLCVEITPEHPLLLFNDPAADHATAAAYAQHVVQAWGALPVDLQPYSVMQVESRGADTASRHQWFRELLVGLQDADVPVALRLADGDLARIYPLARAEELVSEFGCIRGLQVIELPFEDYLQFGEGGEAGMPAPVRWLTEAVDLAARYGRFISIELDRIRWPRAMANTNCAAFYAKLAACKPYVVPVASCRGAHVVGQISALLGLWLEDAAAQWGVGPQSTWYYDAHFISPGVFGTGQQPTMLPGLYRAMIINGAMAGAAAYSFGCGSDLWFGGGHQYWDEAIFPTLTEIIQGGMIARKDFVAKKVRAVYQLAAARTPDEFHMNLRDIDGVLDRGFLIQGAYGMERPGQVPELILNSGRNYWIPLMSPYASAQALGAFPTIIRPGTLNSAQAWTELLGQIYQPDGEGTAFITRIGRGTFVMNSCENRYERQTFKLSALPAPVAQIKVKREAGGILVTWPFREGDLSYKVYRRYLDRGPFTLIAGPTEERQYLDAGAEAGQTVAYSVTALTDDVAPYEGVVDYAECIVLSNVESRIAEEAILSPLLMDSEARPLEKPSPKTPDAPWWPLYAGVSETEMPAATAIVKRLEDWDRAFSLENLDDTMGLYAADYADVQGWQGQYVRRAYKWFFEHYNACAMHRQIRQWDFSNLAANGQVGVLLYCRFEGYALSDPAGTQADQAAWFPRTANGEAWIHFAERNGVWQILRSDPAVPNFKDLLSFSASPFDPIALGPDQ